MKTLARSILAGIAFAASCACAAQVADYRPEREVTGVLRVWGSQHVAQLMDRWSEGFRRFHPHATIESRLRGDASAMIGLEESTADLVIMTRQIVPYDTYGVWRRSHRMPIEIVVANGSLDAAGKAEAIGVFVHPDNPLARLTLAQLDGIFGAQRTGGWKGMAWEPAVARDEGGNIRTWGQLGLGGEWADQPIRPYGPPATFPGGMSFFQIRVLDGADTRAESFLEYADARRMMAALAADRYGIAYTEMSSRSPAVKALALGDPAVAATRESIRDGTYPLARAVYVYLPPDAPTGDALDPPIDPRVREFLRYVLSREGQDDVAREGAYVPLAAAKALEEAAKLRK